MKIAEALQTLANVFPPSLALPNDPVGLQIGDPNAQLHGILVCIDVTPETLKVAKQKKCNLIISYHAPLFVRPTSITPFTLSGWISIFAIQNEIAVYTLHTILDVVPGGTNDVLADRMGLKNTELLQTTKVVPDYKLSLFVPEEHSDRVRTALCDAGAGMIGKYDQCSFQSPGIGTYRPLKDAHPYAGQIGKVEYAKEFRLEVVVPENKLNAVTKAMRDTHPYEEIAYDLYPKADSGTVYGIGRVGNLAKLISWAAAQKLVSQKISPACATVPPSKKAISRVAIFAGSGKSAIAHASAKGAHVLITGELDHHARLEAKWRGLAVIEVGHGESERPVLPTLQKMLKNVLPKSTTSIS